MSPDSNNLLFRYVCEQETLLQYDRHRVLFDGLTVQTGYPLRRYWQVSIRPERSLERFAYAYLQCCYRIAVIRKTPKFTPQHLMIRVTSREVRSAASQYLWLAPGELLSGDMTHPAFPAFVKFWSKSCASTFSYIDNEQYNNVVRFQSTG